MRIATIDIGTNTALLLVIDIRDGVERSALTGRRVVRLGEGVDETGEISEVALERLENTLLEYKEIIADASVDRLIVTGTSASRDARNKEDICQVVKDVLDVDYNIIDGTTEARLAFSACAPPEATSMVVDIGGGSTELVLGTRTGPAVDIAYAESSNVGSVRLTERFITDHPPKEEVLSALRQHLGRQFRQLPPLKPGDRLIGIGGTATTAARLIRGLDEPVLGDYLTVTLAEIEAFEERLWSSSIAEITTWDPEIMQGRADVISCGIAILKHLLVELGANEFDVSLKGLRHAVARVASRPDFDGTIII